MNAISTGKFYRGWEIGYAASSMGFIVLRRSSMEDGRWLVCNGLHVTDVELVCFMAAEFINHNYRMEAAGAFTGMIGDTNVGSETREPGV